MKTNPIFPSHWSTASFGDTVDTSPMELMILGDHLRQCKGAHGHLFALQCAVQHMEGIVAARFMTSLMVVALLIGVCFLVL